MFEKSGRICREVGGCLMSVWSHITSNLLVLGSWRLSDQFCALLRRSLWMDQTVSQSVRYESRYRAAWAAKEWQASNKMMSVMTRMIKLMKAIINLMMIRMIMMMKDARVASPASVSRSEWGISVVRGPPTCQHLAALFAPNRDFFAHEEFAIVFNYKQLQP